MAAKKKASKKTPATRVTVADLRFHGLSSAQLAAIDARLKKAGKKPLSFLIKMLDKTEKHVPELRKLIEKTVKSYG